MKPKAIIVSGYFNPLHKRAFEKAKAKGILVIVNSDLQRELKKVKPLWMKTSGLLL